MIRYVIGSVSVSMLEDVRIKYFNMKEKTDYFKNRVDNKEVLPVAIYLDNKLIGGAYVSSSLSSLFIESIFVLEEYRRNGYAKGLIDYILSNNRVFEDYFKKKFDISRLEPCGEENIEFYKKIGYIGPNEYNLMRKSIGGTYESAGRGIK